MIAALLVSRELLHAVQSGHLSGLGLCSRRSALQFLVQLLEYSNSCRTSARPWISDFARREDRAAKEISVPVFLSRGVVQISSYIDSVIATLLPSGAVAALGYGQVISRSAHQPFQHGRFCVRTPHALRRKRHRNGSRRLSPRAPLCRSPAALLFSSYRPPSPSRCCSATLWHGLFYQTGRFHRADSVAMSGVVSLARQWAALASGVRAPLFIGLLRSVRPRKRRCVSL